MKIWLVQTGEDIPYGNNIRKLRTAVLAEELVRRGHSVTWWAASFSHLKKEWFRRGEDRLTLDNGVQVELLRGRGYTSNVSLARFIDHRIVARQFKRRSRELLPPDFIVCSLPPYDLAYRVALYSQDRGIPLIVDARDYWPDILVEVAPKFLQRVFRAALWSEFRMTRGAFRRATAITAMSEDGLDWALSYCPRERSDSDRVFHLGFRASSDDSVQIPKWLQALQGQFIVAFIGTFTPFHSPLILGRVARQLLSENRHDIAFVIAGAGGDLESKLRSEVAGLSNVTMPGWLDQSGIEALLSRASIGVCPTSIDVRLFPNKTFLYFSRGLPVLSAFRGELQKVLQEDGLGRYYDRNDASTLTAHIKQLCDDPNLYAAMSGKVRKAFTARYDEQVVYRDFADHIEQVESASR
jgi:glycosyltransferase involved in cell wall biosynthesis